ncbi:MAG: VCBS repeat-containing protein [Planctomycetes bacterium]|nr:VCBS repeat-containing protein [Planctomycetota bacterium]
MILHSPRVPRSLVRSACLLAACVASAVGGVAQQSAVPFDVPQVQIGGYAVPFQRLFDFDGDGDLDVVGTSLSTSGSSPIHLKSEVYRNDGSGRFTSAWNDIQSAPGNALVYKTPLAVGDFDGDGYDDFVFTLGSQLWRCASNAPAAGFTRTLIPLPKLVRDLVLADFDGDGADDMALSLGNTDADRYVVIVYATGFVTQATTDLPLDSNQHWIVCDTDGDPAPELVLVNSYLMQPYSIEAGLLVPRATIAFSDYHPMVDAGDHDGDGDVDLVGFYMPYPALAARVEVFERTGPTAWTAQPLYNGGPAEYLADIDNDGDPDGVCCSGGGGGGTYPNLTFPSTFEISINAGGTFQPAFKLPGIGSKSLAGARDVDGDGDVDLVAGRCVYFNRFGIHGIPHSPVQLPTSSELVADLDLDGDVECWVQTTLNPNVEFFSLRGKGDGSLDWQPMVMQAPDINAWITGPRVQGDFDGDGDVDVVLGLKEPSWTGAVLFQALWKNTGGGSFEYAGQCAPAGVSFYLDTAVADQAWLVGDLEGDGDVDIVMHHSPVSWGQSYGETRVFRNTGAGSFVAGPVYTFDQAAAILDFDQDGIADLLMTSAFAPGGLRIRRGLVAAHGPMFEEPIAIAGWDILGKTQHVDVRDFNADGYPDLAFRTGNAQLFLNGIPLGLGFTTLPTLVTSDVLDSYFGEPQLHGIDVDHDGLMDVVAGPFESARSWRVYKQKANAGRQLGLDAFEPGVGVVLSPNFRHDVDGDGDEDFWGEFAGLSLAISGPGTGSRVQYGAGTAGYGGVVPTLGASGPFRVGESPVLRLTGAHGPLAYLLVSSSAASIPDFLFPGLTLLVDPQASGTFFLPLPVAGSALGAGHGHAELPVTVDPAWNGLEFDHQVIVIDPLAPNGLLSATNGLRLVYGL